VAREHGRGHGSDPEVPVMIEVLEGMPDGVVSDLEAAKVWAAG
jgi:hypothetical protein